MKTMVFIDYQNFNISLKNFYKDIKKDFQNINYISLSNEINNKIHLDSQIIKTYLFAYKPCEKLLELDSYKNYYSWLNSIKNSNYFEVIEGTQEIRPYKGIKINERKIKASDFYKKCLKGQLSPHEFEFKTDGTTEMKLLILEKIMKISNFSHMTGDYNCSKPNLCSGKMCGSVSICMGFVRDDETNFYIPNTALKDDTRQLVNKFYRIEAIFSKNITDSTYNSIEYIAKNIDITKILENDNIKPLVDVGILVR